jgi:tricarballylate dehydrogenase
MIDSKVVGRFMPSVFPPIRAESIAELAAKLDLPARKIIETVETFNRAVLPGSFDHNLLDDCRTSSEVAPPKSHWAQKLDKPPFFGYPLRPGITFTYLSVKVNEKAEVQLREKAARPNVFAAGEIMAGNILGKGYPAGFGMTIGSVFGRIAGREAARAAGS